MSIPSATHGVQRKPSCGALLGAIGGLALALVGCGSDPAPDEAVVGGGGSGGNAAGAAGTSGSSGAAGSSVSAFDPNGHGLPGSTPGTWTYLVYLLADNELEPYLLQDLTELMQVGSSDELTILAQIDRAEGGSDATIGGLPDFTGTKRLRVESGQLTELADLGELNLAASGTLSDFVRWGIQTAPADHYALVLRDHGGAWGRFGADMSHPGEGMSLPELTRAVDVALAATGMRGPLDLVGFDACLLGAWEVAVGLSGRAHYLLASEEVAPGHGWNQGPLELLKTGGDARALGAALIDGYAERAEEQGTLARATLSLTDLSRVPALSARLGELTAALTVDGVGEHALAIGKSRAAVSAFGSIPRGGSASMVDLRRWSQALAQAEPALEPQVEALVEAIDAAVVDHTQGSAYSNAGGLSIYFPIVDALYQDGYGELSGIDTWRNFVGSYHQAALSLGQAPIFAPSNERAVVNFLASSLRVSGALVPGSYANLASGTVDVGVVGADGLGRILGETPASLSPSGVLSGEWDERVLRLSQGSSSDYGSFVLEQSSGGVQTLSVPLEYREGGQASTVVLMLAIDATGQVLSQRRYGSLDGAWAEHVAAPGSTFVTLVPTQTESGTIESLPQGVVFDGAADFDVELVTLPPGTEVFVRLRATDYGGKWSAVDNTGSL
ncbi:MAG TPA: clostripain-related cysteine peptidase [Polyangiaceae bacterium]|nr:clostripain-related cysteine peptidase [Polyangiaceae bacterium]